MNTIKCSYQKQLSADIVVAYRNKPSHTILFSYDENFEKLKNAKIIADFLNLYEMLISYVNYRSFGLCKFSLWYEKREFQVLPYRPVMTQVFRNTLRRFPLLQAKLTSYAKLYTQLF